jgi:phosphoribosylaminoimidazolecarboxamide formyltransferase / IMP cyclohydrolase
MLSLQNNCMLGMGSGQPNRRESLRIAFRKAGEEAKGAALASDAFFPFGKKRLSCPSLGTVCSIRIVSTDWAVNFTAWNDAVEEACLNGIGIIAQPGGSMRDDDTVECCNKYGVSLVVTGVRHFRH